MRAVAGKGALHARVGNGHVGRTETGSAGARMTNQAGVFGAARNAGRLAQLGDHPAAVGNQKLFAAADSADVLAETVFQFTDTNGSHGGHNL